MAEKGKTSDTHQLIRELAEVLNDTGLTEIEVSELVAHEVLRRLGARGHKHVLVVPIAFTSDHIETLSELDLEYGEVAHHAGITHYVRAPALNDREVFLDGLAQIVKDHLTSNAPYSSQYPVRCAGCTNPQCRNILNPMGAEREGRRSSHG